MSALSACPCCLDFALSLNNSLILSNVHALFLGWSLSFFLSRSAALLFSFFPSSGTVDLCPICSQVTMLTRSRKKQQKLHVGTKKLWLISTRWTRHGRIHRAAVWCRSRETHRTRHPPSRCGACMYSTMSALHAHHASVPRIMCVPFVVCFLFLFGLWIHRCR